MSAKKVVVLAGGPSVEHEVSVNSAKQIVANLDPKKYEVWPVFISKANNWTFFGSIDRFLGADLGEDPGLHLLDGLKKLASLQPDIVFIGLHGEFGEDGKVQAFLEELKIPFTGSGFFASQLAMNKVVSQDLFSLNDIQTVPTLDFWDQDWQKKPKEILELAIRLGEKLVVKPANLGSSVGVYMCQSTSELKENIQSCVKHSQHVIVQPLLTGSELTCGVVEQKGELVALPATEIRPKNSDFFDYDAKYLEGGSEEITPAPIESEQMKLIQDWAAKAHLVLGCKGYSRTDFLLRGNELFVLELNTLPGMTTTSLLPQQAKVAGIDFCNLLDLIIESGVA